MNLGVANGLGDSFDALTHHQIDVIQKVPHLRSFSDFNNKFV
jgi:hypothetical protein